MNFNYYFVPEDEIKMRNFVVTLAFAKSVYFTKEDGEWVEKLYEITEQDRNNLDKACRSASKNLICRHGMVLSKPLIGKHCFSVSLLIPEDKTVAMSSIPQRLSGIANYLNKCDREHYRKLKSGDRLFNYIQIDEFDS